MPLNKHKLCATDLLEQGTYALRRTLDGLQDRSRRLVVEQRPGGAPRERASRQDQPREVAAPRHR
jgi:hypothetical protein